MTTKNTAKPVDVVISIYDFHNHENGSNQQETETILSFQKDSIIYVMQKPDEGDESQWRDGIIYTKCHNMKRGWFPINYCKRIKIINDNYYFQQQSISSSNIISSTELDDIIKSSSVDTHQELRKSGIRLINNVIRYKFSNNSSGSSSSLLNEESEVDDTIYTLEKIHKSIYYQNLNKYVFFKSDDVINDDPEEYIESITKDQDLSEKERAKPYNESTTLPRNNSRETVFAKKEPGYFSKYLLNNPNMFFVNEANDIKSFEQLLETIIHHLNMSKEAILGKENFKAFVTNSAGTIKESGKDSNKMHGFINSNLLNWTYLKYYKGSYNDFNNNLNLVSKNALLMQNALRIYSRDKSLGIDKKTRKRIRQLLKILNQAFFTIGVNTYLYFNSQKFDVNSDFNTSLSGKTVGVEDPTNTWKQTFAWKADNHNSSNASENYWRADEIDPKYKDDFKRTSSASTIRLPDNKSRFIHSPTTVSTDSKSHYNPSFSLSSPKQLQQLNNLPFQNSVTSSNMFSIMSSKGIHIDLLIKSIFKEYINYELVINEIFQLLSDFQKTQSNLHKTPRNFSMAAKQSSSSASGATKTDFIPQLVPHFLKDSFDKNYWDKLNHGTDLTSVSNITSSSSPQKHLSFTTAPLSQTTNLIKFLGFENPKFPKFTSLNINPDSPSIKSKKKFVTKKFVNKFNKDLMIIIGKTNDAVKIIEQPHTTERDIKFVYCVSNVLKFNTNFLQNFDNLDFELYRYLVALDFNPLEDGPVEYKELSQWRKYLLDDMRLVLLEYSEAKQKYHDMVALGVLYTQQICFQDPFVFSSMRNDNFYDTNSFVKPTHTSNDKRKKKPADDDLLHQSRAGNSASITTLNSLPKKISKNGSPNSLGSLKKPKHETVDALMNLLTRQMIFQDVEINTTEFIDPEAQLKGVMKDFLNNFNQLIAIVDQIASLTESFLTSALSFINNPKVATLINIINEMKERGECENEDESDSDYEKEELFLSSDSQNSKTPAFDSSDENAHEMYKLMKHNNSSFFGFQKSKEDKIGSIVMNPNYTASSSVLPPALIKKYTCSDNEDVYSSDDWLLQNEYDDFLIYDDKTGEVKAGTKIALVEHLTSHITTNPWFNEVMFQNFKTMFGSTFEFFNFIVMRYNLMPQEGLNYREYEIWVQKKLNVVKMSCYMVLFEFVERYWYPQYLENDLLKFNYLLEVFKDDKMPNVERFTKLFNKKIIEPLRENINDKTFSNKDKEAMSKKYANKVIPSHLYFRNVENIVCPPELTLFSFSPKTFAANLTIKEFDIFKNISSLECLDRVLNNKHTWQGGSPNIKMFINMSNLITNFVIYEIVKDVQVLNRVNTIERCIDIVMELYNLNNFSAMTSIISALSSSPVFRLRKTWALVSADYKEKFSKFSKVMDSNKNFNTYRELFNTVKLRKPALPFFGVYLSDLIFTQMGNSDLVKVSRINETLINFSKRAKLQLIIKEIKDLQRFSFNEILEMDDQCMWFIETYCYKDPEFPASKKDSNYIPDIDQLYTQSLIVEPKVATTTSQTIKNVNYKSPRNTQSELRKSIALSKVPEDPIIIGKKDTFVLQDNSDNTSGGSSATSSQPHQQLHLEHFSGDPIGKTSFAASSSFTPSKENAKTDQKTGTRKGVQNHSSKSTTGSHKKSNSNLLSSAKAKNAAFKKLMHYEK